MSFPPNKNQLDNLRALEAQFVVISTRNKNKVKELKPAFGKGVDNM